MIRAQLLFSILVLLSLAFPAHAHDGRHSVEPGSEPPQGCPMVCTEYEACIEHRCVEMCRVGCRVGTYCNASGQCEPLPQPQEPILTEADRQRAAGEESADSKSIFLVDLGGIVGFGLAVGIEWGRVNSFLTRVRFLNTGVMSHAVFSENEFERFEWGFGGGFGVRHYEAAWGNLRGFYYGAGFDYSVLRVADRVRVGEGQMLHSIAPYGEFGYRWVFGTFAVGFGPTIGLRYPIGSGFFKSNSEYCEAEDRCQDVERRRFEGVLHLEVGWFQ